MRNCVRHPALITGTLLAFAIGMIVTIAANGKGPKAQSTSVDNSDLLKNPLYAASLHQLQHEFEVFTPATTRGEAHTHQCMVDAMLFLEAMSTSHSARPPYLDSVVVTTLSSHKVRVMTMEWIGVDSSIPKFEVIGRGGRVVGAFPGTATPKSSTAGKDDWFRALMLFPLLKGEDARKTTHELWYDHDMLLIHLDVQGLYEVEGVRFVSGDSSPPRFVSAYFGNEEPFRAAATATAASMPTVPPPDFESGSFGSRK